MLVLSFILRLFVSFFLVASSDLPRQLFAMTMSKNNSRWPFKNTAKDYTFWPYCKTQSSWWQIYKKTNTKTKAHRQRQRYIQSASKAQCIAIFFFFKSRWFKDFKYYIGCDETDKEKDKDPILCIFRVEYFSEVNIFFRGEYFSGVNILRGFA